MFFLTSYNVWSFTYFFSLTYITLLFSVIIYLLPLSINISNTIFSFSKKNNFYIISGVEGLLFFVIPILLICIINSVISFSSITAWFGHIIFSGFQSKITYFISFFYFLTLLLFFTVTYFSSNEVYDFLIAKFNTFYWFLLLFFSNSTFTVIFVIEVLSTLVFLLITSSIFSTTFFYKNIDFDLKIFFQNSSPFTFIQSLLFYFWISLVSSLNLFIFLIFLFTKILTFDWFLTEHIFYFLTNISSLSDLLIIGLVWFIIMFSILLKCGIVPLFLWKPTFFKGLSFQMLFFYIVFFYFLLFLFFINFVSVYFNCIFYFYSLITVIFIVIGLLFLFFILCETFYLKIFFAISSILNSLLVLISLSTSHNIDLFFFL